MMEFISVILPGMGEMMNVHPLLVHYPIALLSAFAGMEILGYIFNKEEFKIAATWMLYLGTLGALAAVIAGIHAASTVGHSDATHAIMSRHMKYGLFVLLLATFLSLWRIKTGGKFAIVAQTVYLFLAVIMVGLMFLAADLGGLMVYKYGVAVKAVPQPEGHDHGSHDHGSLPMPMDLEEDEFSDIEMEGDGPSEQTGERHDSHDHGAHDH